MHAQTYSHTSELFMIVSDPTIKQKYLHTRSITLRVILAVHGELTLIDAIQLVRDSVTTSLPAMGSLCTVTHYRLVLLNQCNIRKLAKLYACGRGRMRCGKALVYSNWVKETANECLRILYVLLTLAGNDRE